jgi:putative transposase
LTRASDAHRGVATELQLRPKRPVRAKRPSLREFDYRGRHAYHVVIVTQDRVPRFTRPSDVFVTSLQDTAGSCGFRLLAYCFMPEHLHMLVQGQEDSSNLVRFVQRYKQLTAYEYKQRTASKLWQDSYFDRVLRSDEPLVTVAEHIFNNPVSAGLWRKRPYTVYREGSTSTGRLRRTELKLCPYMMTRCPRPGCLKHD